jgi:aryl-alcohol dehydrogenase-like predicted oxidoreductase
MKGTLGSDGFGVSALGLGCMGMSEFHGLADEGEAIAIIRRTLEERPVRRYDGGIS